MKFSITNFFSKCDHIHRQLRIWSRLLKKFLLENFIFCVVTALILLTRLKLVFQSSRKQWIIFSKHFFFIWWEVRSEEVARRCSVKKVFLEILQENTCARVSFKKETLAHVFSCEFCEKFLRTSFLTEPLRWLLLIGLECVTIVDKMNLFQTKICVLQNSNPRWLDHLSLVRFYSVSKLGRNWFHAKFQFHIKVFCGLSDIQYY